MNGELTFYHSYNYQILTIFFFSICTIDVQSFKAVLIQETFDLSDGQPDIYYLLPLFGLCVSTSLECFLILVIAYQSACVNCASEQHQCVGLVEMQWQAECSS